MKVVTAEQMQKIDRVTISEYGFPGEVLMGIAGKSVFDCIIENFDNIKRTLVFCGTGNNGGDGFVISHFLFNAGVDVIVYVCGKIDKLSETSKVYYNLCKNAGIKITEIDEHNTGEIVFFHSSLIIDAITGTGFKGKARGITGKIIRLINNSNVFTLSVDLPSGLPSNGNAPEGDAVFADLTVTIGLPKVSLVTYPGKNFTGKLTVVEIGFPKILTDSDDIKTELVDDAYVAKRLKNINHDDINKSDNGHLLLVGGFDNMEGAIMMTAKAALETGVGLITLLTTEKSRNIIAGKIPELITYSLNNETGFSKKNFQKLNNRKYDALVIGPGLGRDNFSKKVFKFFIENSTEFGIKKVLIDGDGLYHLANNKDQNLFKTGAEILLTPHFAEASRICDKDIITLKNNRLKAAMELARDTSSTILMKGALSIISNEIGSLINTSGNSAMATAGSGDVLSGITGALLLKELPVIDAAGIGAYIHGKSADIYCREHETDVLKATDILFNIRKAFCCK